MTRLGRVGLLLALSTLIVAWCELLYRAGVMGALR